MLMKQPPAYFEAIRRRAEERWITLESDPELAGPWHQLFKQVQSPRHVVSELLQNADDANAREARVRIEDNVFVFEHDGEDFSADHFASLCRFGYSNKRHLHTIGFRGIGFKSTFSLGARVEVCTPTLSVVFHRERFTEPIWIDGPTVSDGWTSIRVRLEDPLRAEEVQNNLREWRESPVSLLFFRHLRHVEIDGGAIAWERIADGPVPNSAWVALGSAQQEHHLVVRSDPEPYPAAAIEEIRQERLLNADEAPDLPPCSVDVVIGAHGRLFVVLPTGVATSLPFASNAPFVQDPARMKIKDPETSPTNRWLLKRIGRLAADAMAGWLGQAGLSPEARAKAYRILPPKSSAGGALERECASLVVGAMESALVDRAIALHDDGALGPRQGSVAFPPELHRIWPDHDLAALFDSNRRATLSRHIHHAHRARLIEWGVCAEVGKTQILDVLVQRRAPRPSHGEQLQQLWEWLAPELTRTWPLYERVLDIGIVPVEGASELHPAAHVIRVGQQQIAGDAADWQFLTEHLAVVDRDWLRSVLPDTLAQDGSTASASHRSGLIRTILTRLQLDKATEVGAVVDRAAASLARRVPRFSAEYVRLAHIAAKLGVQVESGFRLATRDGQLRAPLSEPVCEGDVGLEELVPNELRASLLLHDDYTRAFSSYRREEWDRWIASGRAAVLQHPPIAAFERAISSRPRITQEIVRRSGRGTPDFHYVTNQFVIRDWDFDARFLTFWDRQTFEVRSTIWGRVAERVLRHPDLFIAKWAKAGAVQIATSGTRRSITSDSLLPEWVLRLRAEACLPDTRGVLRKPSELLRRTPDTEPLLNIELFVRGDLDTEATRPLLDMLGVQSRPTGPDRVLECLRSLAQSANPPISEVESWYLRIDRLYDGSSTADQQRIRSAFANEALIRTEDGAWATSAGVFRRTDDVGMPGLPLVRESVREFSLWTKIGVADQPSAERIIDWLNALPTGNKLPADEFKRVRSALARYPARIWAVCGRWVNLAGEWVPVSSLRYALTMQALVPWQHLHEGIKQQTADFRELPREAIEAPPFSALPPLAEALEEHVLDELTHRGAARREPWIATLGVELCRVEFDDDGETERVRRLARRLGETSLRQVDTLEVTPYVAGVPAGVARNADVVWLEQTLFTSEVSRARLAKRLPEELAKPFGRAEIKAAFDYAYERAPADIRAYLRENFRLAPDAFAADSSTQEESSGAGLEERGMHEEALGFSATVSDTDLPDSATALVSLEDGPDGFEEPVDPAEADTREAVDASPSPRLPRREGGLPLIARFAGARGFQPLADGTFRHRDGSWLVKTDAPFHWELRNAAGTPLRYLWLKDHCLERSPVEIPADVWGLVERQPTLHTLVMADENGAPNEYLGSDCLTLKGRGVLQLFPATFRLRLDQNT
jgi:hypothetical protein